MLNRFRGKKKLCAVCNKKINGKDKFVITTNAKYVHLNCEYFSCSMLECPIWKKLKFEDVPITNACKHYLGYGYCSNHKYGKPII